MNKTTEYLVFSKMFQPPVTRGPEELCDLLAAAGCDGVQWTVRPGGHGPARGGQFGGPRNEGDRGKDGCRLHAGHPSRRVDRASIG